jgi:hypothetical protein
VCLDGSVNLLKIQCCPIAIQEGSGRMNLTQQFVAPKSCRQIHF